MFLILIAIIIMLVIVVKSYTYIDNNDVTEKDLIKALIPALIAVVSLGLRETYFAMPEGGMVSGEYLMYRNILMGIFVVTMGYVVRISIYSCVYFYRKKG